jgi:beta-galactosidase
MITLGAQYYRPPFPNDHYWDDDMRRMADAGLNTVQLWVLWGWVEPSPGEWLFDDYDRLVDLAGRHGLGVVLSAISEIQPYWIHRAVPGSEMVDNMGHTVVSSNRRECHFGLTPGGCTDHPEIWQRMEQFFSQVVTRYRSAPHLRGWDAWNELRWNVMAEVTGQRTCYCHHTIAAFIAWLQRRYGSLSGLNAAWERRYACWEDVRPGRVVGEPYTHSLAFQRFLTERTSAHGTARCTLIRSLDAQHPVTLHGMSPCVDMQGDANNFPLSRGNDWDYAATCDGVGTSSFPAWGVGVAPDLIDFADRIARVASAAFRHGKEVWLSEVQGGRASDGFALFDPVDAVTQQRWLWTGHALGADMLLFWCWNDEVFGRESGGFGITGQDGQAPARLAALRRTRAILEREPALRVPLRGDPPAIGLWFSPAAGQLAWAQEQSAARIVDGLRGWCRAFTRGSFAWRLVEERHRGLDGLRLLVLPRSILLDESAEREIEAWVRAGGLLLCESETGAFSGEAIWRPAGERWLSRLTGGRELGRRNLGPAPLTVTVPDGPTLTLTPSQWRTPMHAAGTMWGADPEGALVQEVAVGAGRVLLIGTYLSAKDNPDLPRLAEALAGRAGLVRRARVLDATPERGDAPFLRCAHHQGHDLIHVFTRPGDTEAVVEVAPGVLAGTVRDLIGEAAVTAEDLGGGRRRLRWAPGPWGVSVLSDLPPEC